MTMQELARQENLAMKRHWAMPYGESGARADAEIAARIPENWYGPEKKPGPLFGKSGGVRCDATAKAMRNCHCSVCAPIIRHWK